MSVVSMKQLLEAGVHFGHQTRRWNPKMAKYIFTERNGIYIIDLQKTVKKAEEAYNFVRSVAEEGKSILFVGTKKQAQEAIKEEAIKADMYYVNERWLGGMMTNFKTIQTRVKRLKELETMAEDGTFDVLTKKEVQGLKHEMEKLEKYLNGKEVSIDPKSAMLIAEAIGANLSRLTSELDKIILSLPKEDRRVTPQVVEDQVGVSKEFNVFELRSAIVNRNVYKANQIVKYFDENPKAGSLYAFLPNLFSFFQNLMIAHYSPNKQSQEAVAEWLELRSPWAAKDYMTGMRNFTATKVMQIIDKIREIDAKSKGLDNPNTAPGELMKELIFYILH